MPMRSSFVHLIAPLALLSLAACPGPSTPPNCVEAQACTPSAPEACKDYATTCTAAGASCEVTGDRFDGTSCGPGLVCSSGACVAACSDDGACTPASAAPCRVYGLACNAAHTSGTCAAIGNSPEGTACGSGRVCAADECVDACVEGAACTPSAVAACATYATTCNAAHTVGVCSVSGNQADGTGCETGKVCKTGGCIDACVAAQPCTAPSPAPCRSYATSCSADLTETTCVDTGALAEGTSCGAGMTCQAGVCKPMVHSLSGTISGTLVANVLLTLSGAGAATTHSQLNGSYSFTGLADGVYTVTPSALGATFSPASATVTLAGADGTANFVSSLAQLTLFPTSGWPTDIVTGGDGNLWVSDTSGYANKIMKITPAGGVTVFTLSTTSGYVGLGQLAPVPGGIVFTEPTAGKIGVMAYDGTFFEWPRSKTWVNPIGIAADAHDHLWVSEANYGNFPSERMDRVARYTNWSSPSLSVTVDDFSMSFGGYSPGSMASAAVHGSDRLYFTIGGAGAVAWVEPSGSGTMKSWDQTGFTKDIIAGPKGSMWFTEPFSIGAITVDTAAVVTHYAIPDTNPGPDGITLGADGAVWFAETRAGKLGRLDTGTGVVTEYPLAGAHPLKLTRGPDGNLWFTTQEYKVGRYIP